jgi:hypothetical protein
LLLPENTQELVVTLNRLKRKKKHRLKPRQVIKIKRRMLMLVGKNGKMIIPPKKTKSLNSRQN